LFGQQHNAVLEWLVGDWWQKGPPVAVIQGFPGIGKTEIALQAMTEFRKAHSNVPTVLFDCPETTTGLADDLLLTLAEELAALGDTDLIESVERGEDVNSIFSRVLAVPRLIIVDEAQRLLIGSTSGVSAAIAATLERFSRTADAEGRLLLLSNRDFGTARWTERVESMTLLAPKPNDAEALLHAELQRRNLGEAIPARRYRDVVIWLGCNPRALRLLASALVRESLDELIGLAPEAWEARDRPVSAQLLREFEKAVLTRAEERLDQPTQVFLRRLSVLRRSFDRRVLEALSPNVSDMVQQRDELIARFMLEFRNYFYELHPILRDAVRLRMSGAEKRRAHLSAGRFYAAPFRARRTLGEAEKLGARFIEARYHFTIAESESDLVEISERFENHLRAQFHPNSPVPTNAQERDERIALLSALLQARGAKGLEYYLARCLVARNQPGDMDRALPHVRRATGPQAPADAWVLRVKVEHQVFGSTVAVRAAREGIKVVPPTQSLCSLYQVAAEILARDGKPSESVELLREGIKVVPPSQNLFSLYQAAAEILARDGKLSEAVELLRDGIKIVPATQSLFSLYQTAAEILARDGKANEAVELMREGMTKVPADQNRYKLAETAILIAYRENTLSRIRPEHYDPRQRDLLTVVAALAGSDAAGAAKVGVASTAHNPQYLALFVQTAFAYLCAGEPDRAASLLRSYLRPIMEESPIAWLLA
jgi:tetratricopeptide (TPR) repeat protein